MRKLCFIFIIIFAELAAGAQDVRVKAEVDSNSVLIGDHIRYSLVVEQPADIQLNLTEYNDTLAENLEILSQSPVDTAMTDKGRMVLKKNFLITSFDTGFYQIPPYRVSHKTEKGIKNYYSDYVPLKVNRVNVAPSDSTDVIFDIVSPAKVGYSAGEILPWVLLAIAVITGAILGYKYLKRPRKTEEEEKSKIPDEPIHIITFRELDKLENKELWQKGKVKEYYSRLTEILRFYLEIRYGIRALEMTSEEIINKLSGEGIEKNNFESLKVILRNADLSKFARYSHDSKTNTGSMDAARTFVRDTYKTNDPDQEGDDMKADQGSLAENQKGKEDSDG